MTLIHLSPTNWVQMTTHGATYSSQPSLSLSLSRVRSITRTAACYFIVSSFSSCTVMTPFELCSLNHPLSRTHWDHLNVKVNTCLNSSLLLQYPLFVMNLHTRFSVWPCVASSSTYSPVCQFHLIPLCLRQIITYHRWERSIIYDRSFTGVLFPVDTVHTVSTISPLHAKGDCYCCYSLITDEKDTSRHVRANHSLQSIESHSLNVCTWWCIFISLSWMQCNWVTLSTHSRSHQ